MGGRGAWSSDSKILKENDVEKKVIKTKRVEIASAKISQFALKKGTKHYQDFIDAGYTEKDERLLEKDLKKLYRIGKKNNIQYNTDTGNIKFEISGELGKNRLRFTTGWQIDKDDNKSRFITGYRK